MCNFSPECTHGHMCMYTATHSHMHFVAHSFIHTSDGQRGSLLAGGMWNMGGHGLWHFSLSSDTHHVLLTLLNLLRMKGHFGYMFKWFLFCLFVCTRLPGNERTVVWQKTWAWCAQIGQVPEISVHVFWFPQQINVHMGIKVTESQKMWLRHNSS